MRHNYHTHTARCHHAEGEDREYVERAIAGGLSVLGFSDHTPCFFEGDYYSTFRMRPEAAEDYVTSVLALREEYRGEIDILLGFETEYYPRSFERLMRFYEDYPIDYLLLGQHCVGHEPDGAFSVRPCYDTELLRAYVSQVIEGMNTGCFSYLAHPDVFHYIGDEAVYREAAEQICREAARLRLPLEINLLGIRDQRFYPRRSFFETAAACGCQVVLGSDAHSPDTVCDTASEAVALTWARELGLTVVDEGFLHPPFSSAGSAL